MPENTESTFDITAGLNAVEAAELLGKLERGHQEAYRVQKTYWRTPEWTSRKAMSEELNAQSVEAHWATFESGLRKPGETVEQFATRARHEAEMAPELKCPECGEPALSKPTTDLVPWEAHGLEHPQWSHSDGSALCPVVGPSGGYEPAQPHAPSAEPCLDTTKLDPPASLQATGPITDFVWSLDPEAAEPGAEGDGFDQVTACADAPELEAD
jgi:hypothetical protein